MRKYEFINYFWAFRARMHYNAQLIRTGTSEYHNMRMQIRAFADGLSWIPNFSGDDYKKFIRIADKYLDMVKHGEINPRYNDYGE